MSALCPLYVHVTVQDGGEGHAWVLQFVDPGHPAPPQDGVGLLHARVPPPQVTEQALHPPSTTGVQLLHDWLLAPEQPAPQEFGVGLLQLRVCVPPEHADHALHPPLTGVQVDAPWHWPSPVLLLILTQLPLQQLP